VVFNYPDDDVNPDVEALGPIDVISMKQNYIKRCVAVGGDLLEIKAGTLYIDGQPAWKPEFLQTSYFVYGLSSKVLEKKGFRFENSTNVNAERLDASGGWLLNMNEKVMNEIAAIPGVKVVPRIDDLNTMTAEDRSNHLKLETMYVAGNPLSKDPRQPKPKNALFPKKPHKVLWTRDDYGPLWIPKKGASIPLNDSTLTFYEKCIRVYEDNTLEVKNGKYYVNGAEATSYTFKMNYYWMMGDNRHQSLDSRYWGFVPEDHIVGRPWFVLFSFEGGPRWDRFFRPATKWEP
jgi:signal peptidase I